MSDIFNYPEKGGGNQEPPPPFPGTGSTSQSTISQLLPTSRGTFACITLNMVDRLRFIGFSAEDLAALRVVVKDEWTKGIVSERTYGGAEEIALRGTPWGTTIQTYDEPKNLIRRLLESLYNRGWVVHSALDVSRKAGKGRLRNYLL